MNSNDRQFFGLLSLAGVLFLATAWPTGALAFAQPASTPPVDRGAPESIPEAVGAALPALRGVPPGRQLQTLRWMLSVEDDRRLVSLFDDLRADRGQTIEDRAVLARQRLEELASRLEQAGHQASKPEAGVARIDRSAPPPNYFPPSLIQEFERQPDDPEAARALEEARRASPRGVRPPGGR